MKTALRVAAGHFPAYFSILFFIAFGLQSFGQATGDYRSNVTGNWGTRTNWQRYNGTTWVTPTAGQGYPGQNAGTGAVTILSGNTITLNANLANAIGSLQVAGTCTIGGFNITVTGVASVSGTLSITNTAGTKIFAGLVTINSGGTWNNSGNSAITFRGGVTNSGTFTSGTGIYTFNTNNQALTGIFTIPSVTVTTITLSNNTSLIVSAALTGTGGLTQAASATLNIGGTSTITTLTATNAGNTVNYSGAAQTIKATNYYNLTLSGSGNDVLPNIATTVGGNLTLSGTVSTITRAMLTVNGNLATGDGTTFTAAGFALTVTGTTTIGAGVSGSMVISSATGTKIFIGLIRINAGANWNNSGNSPITVEGGVTNSGTFTAGTGVYTFSINNQALNGTFTIARVTVTGITLTNNNTLAVGTALSGTGTLSQAANAALNIGGTSAITTLQATNNGNTVNYTGGAQTVNATNYYNLTMSGGNVVKTMQTGTTSIAGNLTLAGGSRVTAVVGLTIGGNFVLGAGTRFTSGAFTHNVKGNWVNNGTTFTPGTGTINFNGGAAQTIGGTSATTFSNLTINNSSGVSLNDGTNTTNKTVTGILTLTAGYLTTTATNLLILNSGATASVANATGVPQVPQYNSPYVNGPMNKVGNQAFIFPVGVLGTGCVPIGISAPSTVGSTFQAQYIRSSAGALGTITSANLFNVSICEHWILNRTVGASTINVTGYWNQNSPCNGEAPGQYVTDLTTISLAHFNGTNWNTNSVSANSFTTGGTISGGVTWSGVTTFSPFALGNNSAAKINPLIIKLDYFTAVKATGYNVLSWKAECTSSSNLFEAQRSYNGTDFTSVDTVNVDAASDCSQAFVYNDYSATGDKIYYRIKTTDVSGNIGYSDIKLLTSQASALDIISVSPNPMQGNATLKIFSLQNDHVELIIFGIDGREFQRRTVQVPIGESTISLQTSGLSKGLYIVKGTFSGGQTNTIKFIKQ